MVPLAICYGRSLVYRSPPLCVFHFLHFVIRWRAVSQFAKFIKLDLPSECSKSELLWADRSRAIAFVLSKRLEGEDRESIGRFRSILMRSEELAFYRSQPVSHQESHLRRAKSAPVCSDSEDFQDIMPSHQQTHNHRKSSEAVVHETVVHSCMSVH